ncbi:MAG: sensor histidine kinase [Bacteroidia bacterium]|nr:sensor histidine kinase [Bacteroidia bacterium]
MSIKKKIDQFISIGVRDSYQPWETYLTRKINSITLVGTFNMFMGAIFFLLMGYPQVAIDCIVVIIVAPFVFILNKYKNYVWAAYSFYIIGLCFFISMNLKTGKDSYILLFYFPMVISLVQLLGRRETLKHLLVIAGMFITSAVIIALGYKYDWYAVSISETAIANTMVFNIILSVFTAIAFIIIVVTESMAQERKIKKMLSEKEILLSEVFHRVKNNMNIVTSLLSLKKNSTDSKEVQEALDECRNRVFSMALVHQKIFEREHVIDLNFKDYINELLKELMSSYGIKEQTTIQIDADDVFIELSNAIPCGLILNEFVTNSFKYAQSPDKKLQINITLKKQNEYIELQLRDNGPGLPSGLISKPNTLGMELMRSLSEQINGDFSFTNENGLVFKLRFKQ